MTTLNLPSLKNFGNNTFQSISTNPAPALTITLGATPPTVGTTQFNSGSASKNITIKVPSGATAYGTIPSTITGTTDTTATWVNGFRDYGWNGTATIQIGLPPEVRAWGGAKSPSSVCTTVFLAQIPYKWQTP
jgi:hypothetical protein